MGNRLVHFMTIVGKFFLPLLFVANQASITLFTHVHIINGVMVVHSHPYQKSANHHHAKGQLQIIYTWNHSFTFDKAVNVPSFEPSVVFKKVLYSTVVESRKFFKPIGITRLRAPPCL